MNIKSVIFDVRDDKICFILKNESGEELRSVKLLSDKKIILFDFPDLLGWEFVLCDEAMEESLWMRDKIERLYFDSFPINNVNKIVMGLIVNPASCRTFNTDSTQDDIESLYPILRDIVLKRVVV